ncbi:MAG TPA: DNA polymerase I [Bacteroidota bacterium]|nr:DNA polymerase I [Bacteroidota bacterium]
MAKSAQSETSKNATRQRLFLIDGMAIAYRSYFAFIQRPLMNSRGENTSAIYGFVTFLNKILEQEKPDYIAVVFDTSEPTFRHRQYAAYKATRQKMPEDMASQLDLLKDVVRAYNIPVIEFPGYEADDVIGTLAKRAEKEGAETYLVTGDKDFMQLVSEKIKMYKPGRQGNDVEILGIEDVKRKFGVPPDQVVDVLALVGDSSDNVPGVPGIGEKTAIPLIQQHGSLSALFDKIEEIPQKGLRQKLETHRHKALLSRQLVTIDTAVPVNIDFHTLRASDKDVEKLIALFERLEFRALIKKLREEHGTNQTAKTEKEQLSSSPAERVDITSDEHTYRLVKSEQEFHALCERLKSASSFVIDTETTSTDALRAEIVGLAFALKPREAWFVSLAPKSRESGSLFDNSQTEKQFEGALDPTLVFKSLKPILENPSIKKIGQNIKYDMLALSQQGIRMNGVAFDTMVASYVLREDGQHNLDALAMEYLNYKMITYNDLTGSGKDQKPIRAVPIEQLADYACEDADITLRLYEILHKRVEQEQLQRICEEIEFPLISVLARMEEAGVAIDTDFLNDMSKELERMLDNLTREIHALGGGPFNINSTQQLSDVLFSKLKLSPVRKTKTGFSTDVGVLETLRDEHPIIEKLLEYRQLAKLKSTYVDALPELVNPRTGRVHTSFNQTVAATGRLSSSDPNLQNIPIRTELGRSIRRAFVPSSKDHRILSADYSQIELRVMAHIAGDEGLAEAFRNKEDVHATTAAKIFGVSSSEVTRDMRRKAKEVNFGIMYGIGPFGLANRLEISQTEAREIIQRYFDRFPKVKQYINDTITEARAKGYVSTLLGRRRYLPDINSRNQNVRQNAERQAINMPIQGTAADMIKLAMIRIDRDFLEKGLKSKMVLQVHDELVFDIDEREENDVKNIVKREMQDALKLSVPIDVEIGIGKNWLEAH